MRRLATGFTLYELLLTLTLVAVIVGIALPSWSAGLARQRQRAEIDALFHAIHLARKESIMRRKVVSLCPSIDTRHCAATRDWSRGWLMFENKDRDSPPVIDDGEPILQRHVGNAKVQIAANRKGFTLRATFLRATNGTLVFCDPNDRIAPKALVVSYTGRPRIASFKNSARNNRKPDWATYSCAD